MRIPRYVTVFWPVALALTAGCSSSSGNKATGTGTPKPPDAGIPSSDAAAGDGASAPLVLGPDDVDDDLPMPLAAGIAPTPPMGWNSWNTFAGGVSDTLIRQVADALVSSGMQAAGYQYVNIDDGWARTVGGSLPNRDANGNILPDPTNFPNGIGPVADYVHAQGMKLGIYSDRGTATCGNKTASQGFEMSDATTFASWGVDYLKYDNCYATLDIQTQYQTMSASLAASERPFVFSLCAWNFYEWGIGTGQLWRTTSDIQAAWNPPPGSIQGSIFANVMASRYFAAYAGPMKYMVNPSPGATPPAGASTPDGVPYGWNDADMLEVGAPALTATENQSHFSLWAVTAAPLIAGNDVRTMSASTQTILTNPEIIAIDQDALGLAGYPVWTSTDLAQSVWARPLNQTGVRAVVLLNGGESSADVTFHLADIGLRTAPATLHDAVAHADLPTPITDSYTASQIPPHGTVTLTVTGVEPARPYGTAFLSDLQWIYQANGLGTVHKDEADTVVTAVSHAPLSLRGTTYAKGLGMDAPSSVIYRLAQKCHTFTADVGVDDMAGAGGSVVFQVWSDGEKLFDSGIVTGQAPVQNVNVSLDGKRRLMLVVTNGGDGNGLDRADWGSAQVVCDP
jgi:alpha-galactosidase